MRNQQLGFTLLETAIVLVIVGLLASGVSVGSELIASARVRALVSQHEGIKVAYLGFLDRYRALPGDYHAASINISCTPACSNGDGNGLITGIADNPAAPINEYIAVWEHLSNAGFINGRYSYGPAVDATTTPIFMFGQYPTLKYDAVYDGTSTARHNLKTGNRISSVILAEADRKIDDGYPTTGAYRFSAFNPAALGGVSVSATGPDPVPVSGSDPSAPVGAGSCYSAATPNPWATSVSNCGATSLL